MRYVAFLRAINIGNRRIKMTDLRSLYEDMGFADVATYIASGNVILSSPSPPLPHELESSFHERFGFSSEVFLRSAVDVTSLIAAVPWRGKDVTVEVSFLEHEPSMDQARALEVTAVEPEKLAVVNRDVLFLRGLGRGVPTTHREATSMKILGMKMTRRGMTTVEQIADRYLPPGR